VRYVLGIDQGGTKTAVVILDRIGNILGSGKSKGAYHISDGIDYAMDSILDAANLALEESGATWNEIDAISAGMTGMDWPEDYRLLKSSLIQTFGIKNVQVCNDSIVAMYSGTVKKYGAVLCAGTGLNVAVKSPDGDEFVLGFYIDDRDQGGSALGRRAIRKVFDAEINLCKPTKLTELFLQNAHVKTVDGLLHRYVTDEEFGGKAKDMVPQIIDLANDGDSVAIELVKEFARDLSRYVYVGLQKYDMLDMNMDVVLSGSVLKGNDNLLTLEITRELRKFARNSNVINSRFEPVVGAGLSALMMFEDYDHEKDSILKNIYASAEKFKLIR
jgi:N-acetylglucosamine kinase-like BadF-type ATPase